MVKNEKYCDLHVHSNCSDGSVDPDKLIEIAKSAGLCAVALTDHNTLAGVERFEGSAEGSGIIPIAGVEVTAEACSKEVHILGLFIKKEMRDRLTEYLSVINLRKDEENRRTIERLAEAGYEIDYAAAKAIAGEAQPNRVHIARALMAKGYISTVREVFDGLLREGGEFYKGPKRLDALEVISFLSDVGAVPVMAHPMINVSYDDLESFLPSAVEAGLVGMETIYTLYDEKQTEQANELAEKYGLLPSGGSDFHGINKPDTKMGVGKNNISVPFEIYENLRKRI